MTAAPSPRARRARASATTRTITTADAPARHLMEAQFQRQVTDLLTRFGWYWTHTPDSRTVQGYAGVPDLMACRAGRILFAELKTSHGRIRTEQREWLARLVAVRDVEVHIWRPVNLEQIMEVLR